MRLAEETTEEMVVVGVATVRSSVVGGVKARGGRDRRGRAVLGEETAAGAAVVVGTTGEASVAKVLEGRRFGCCRRGCVR